MMRSASGDLFFWLLRLLERAWERAADRVREWGGGGKGDDR